MADELDFDVFSRYNTEYQANLFDLKRYFYNVEKTLPDGRIEFAPVIGEDNNCMIGSLAYIVERMPVVIQGYAGSGKTQIMEAIANLIPEHQRMMIKVGSEKFAWYQTASINKADYIIVSEYQKATGDFLEVLKDWGERRESQYNVTNVTKKGGEDGKEDRVNVYTLDYKPFLTSKAYENKEAKITEELGRRVIQLYTSSSVPMNERILRYKLECKSKRFTSLRTMGDDEVSMLKMHLEDVLRFSKKHKDLEIKNPAAPGLIEYVPKIFRISCSLINYYLQMIDAITKFFYKDRILVNNKYLLSTLADNYYAWIIYGQSFVESCLDMNVLGRKILSVFENRTQQRLDDSDEPTEDEMLTETQVINKLREQGIILKRQEVRAKLIELLMTGYLDKMDSTGGKTSKAGQYYKTRMAEVLTEENPINWHKMNEVMMEQMRENFPSVAEDYIKRYCTGEIIVRHPMSGQTHNLLAKEDSKVVKKKRDEGILEGIMQKIADKEGEKDE